MEKCFFQLSNLSQLDLLFENPTHWGLETAVCPSFCSLNLSHTQQSYFMPKKSKLPTREGWYKVFP